MKQKHLTFGLLAVLGAGGLLAGAIYYYGGQSSDPAPAVPAAPDPAVVAQTAARATAGEIPAQLQMGLWCLAGSGQKLDEHRAAEWFRQAAEAGNAEGQYRLATLYQNGRGTERDPAKAVLWFTRAAAQHHAAALYNLGAMYEAGQGVPADSPAAARFFQQAAELGDAYAQYNLARRCEEGHGLPRNLIEAWKWYELADAGGVPDTLHARHALEGRLTAEERRQAREAAARFRREHPSTGPH